MKKSPPNANRMVASPFGVCLLIAFIGVGLFACAALALDPTPMRDGTIRPLHERQLVAGIAASFGAIGLFCALACGLRWRIIADSAGLRWRKLGGWNSCRWSEVEDYYLVVQENNKRSIHRVETRKGKFRFNQLWSKQVELAKWISEHAKNAKVSEWLPKGERDFEIFPSRFDYASRKGPAPIWGIAGLLLVMNLLLLSLWSEKHGPWLAFFSDPEWPFSIVPFIVLNLLYGCFGLIVIGAKFGFGNDRKSRAKQSVSVTKDRIFFENGSERVSLAWSDIVSFRTERMTCRTRSFVDGIDQGLDFTAQITRYSALQRLIARMAPEAEARGRENSPDEDSLKDSEWDAVPGVRVHSFRTRSVRAMGILATAMATQFTSPVFVPGIRNSGNPCVFLMIALPLWVLAAWIWLWYRKGRVIVGSDSFTLVSSFGVKRIEWEEIEGIKIASSTSPSKGSLILIAKSKQITVPSLCARPKELRQEVKRRLNEHKVPIPN